MRGVEPVAKRLGEVAGGDVLHGVLRRHDLEAVDGPHLADVRQLQEALVERGQEHVLHRLGMRLSSLMKSIRPSRMASTSGPGKNTYLPVPCLEHERRVEPARVSLLSE